MNHDDATGIGIHFSIILFHNVSHHEGNSPKTHCIVMTAQATVSALAAPASAAAPSNAPAPPSSAAVGNENNNKPSPADEAGNSRLSNTTAVLPIVYGSIAFYMGKQADEFQTHEWTLFVRGPNNEDLSTVISKVVFQLHASFAQPIREYTQPPFEVTERGWGEFEAQIRIHWKDPTEKATIVSQARLLFVRFWGSSSSQNEFSWRVTLLLF